MEYRKIVVIGMIVVIGVTGYFHFEQKREAVRESAIEAEKFNQTNKELERVVQETYNLDESIKTDEQREEENAVIERLRTDINIGDEYSITVLGMKGDFVNIAVNMLPEGGGYGMIVMRQAEKYIQVYVGQEYPSCTVVDQYKIPKEITKVCLVGDDPLVTDVRENTY